jgi:hypothetical protein
MLATTSHRTERVLDRLAARARPRRQSPLQPRDKRTQYEIRLVRGRYDDEMSQPHDNLMQRERDMAAWLTAVAREKKRVYGWSTDETIDSSSIDRATWYRWKKISRPGNMPKAPTLVAFCQSLGLDPAEPFRILGYTTADVEAPTVVLPDPESHIDRRIRLLRIAIDRPGIKPEERQELEVQVVRLLAEKRSMEDAIKAADKALKRHGAA